MRRAPIVITATVLGTAGVLLFKPLGTTAAAGSPSTDAGAASTAAGSGTASGSTSSSGTSSSSTSSTSAAAPSSTPSASSSASASGGTWTGTAITTRFGTTRVRVTIAAGRITAVTAVQINDDDPRSQQISEGAVPALRQEVLSAQSAAVDTVSGATYTSLAYEASLQAALDEAGYTAPDGKKASTETPVVEEHGH